MTLKAGSFIKTSSDVLTEEQIKQLLSAQNGITYDEATGEFKLGGDIRIIGCGLSQANVDATINNLYDVRSFLGTNTGNVNLSGGTSATPGGDFQATAGFMEGASDGIPTTPQEKMYVLEKNYNLIVTTN